MAWIVVIAGAVLFGIYLMGRVTPTAQMDRPIIDTATILDWGGQALPLIVVACAVIIWFLG